MDNAPSETLVGPNLLAAALAGSLIGIVPALGASGSVFSTWLLGAASAALLLGPAVLGLTSNGFLKQAGPWLLAGLGWSLAPLTVLGGLLKTATHHRPLGAATFAVIACGVVLGSVVFCWRAGVVAESSSPARGRLIRSVVGGVALLSGAFAAFELARLALSSGLIQGAVQLGLLAVALWFTSRGQTRRRLAIVPGFVGIGAWLCLVLAGVVLAVAFEPASTDGPSTAILWLLFAS